MSEPDRVLVAAAVEAVRPLALRLLESGWPTEITVHAEPLKVTLDIDLSGLKRPTQEAGTGCDAVSLDGVRCSLDPGHVGLHRKGELRWRSRPTQETDQ